VKRYAAAAMIHSARDVLGRVQRVKRAFAAVV